MVAGTRRGEIVGLRWSNVDLDRGVVYIRIQRTICGAMRGCGRCRGNDFSDDHSVAQLPGDVRSALRFFSERAHPHQAWLSHRSLEWLRCSLYA